MPTELGNVLRRAERTAGERYGLDTVHTYPRLYPHLSKQLDKEIGQQLDLVDTGASIAVALESALWQRLLSSDALTLGVYSCWCSAFWRSWP